MKKESGAWFGTSTREWSKNNNPRIVRVSRTFGGKDRHSKVCTVRGLKDRRIRLSVPTAIQLYDLQHRLGLSQPSKVVDWLIHASKHEIDKLPPLPYLIPDSQIQSTASHDQQPFPNMPAAAAYNNYNPNFFQFGGALGLGYSFATPQLQDSLPLYPPYGH